MDKEISNLLTRAMQDHEKAEAIEDAFNKIKQGAFEIVLNSKGGEPIRNILRSLLRLNPEAAVVKKGTPVKVQQDELKAAIEEGLTVLEIAKKMCVAEQTVRNAMCRYRITMPERPRKNAKITETPIKPRAEVAPVQHQYKPVRKPPEKIALTDAERKMLLSGQQVCGICKKKFTPTAEWVYKDLKGHKVSSYSCSQSAKGEGRDDKKEVGRI